MGNLIEDLSPSYFNDFFAGALFIYEDKILKVRETTRTGVLCVVMETGDLYSVPKDFFTGFKVFAYPSLGYRKSSTDYVGLLSRRQNSRRGLRLDSVSVEPTPLTAVLTNMKIIVPSLGSDSQRATQIMKPVYDDFETDLPRLLSGEVNNLILSSRILIEPNTMTSPRYSASSYLVYYNSMVVGRMNQRGSIRWMNPKHQTLLPSASVRNV